MLRLWVGLTDAQLQGLMNKAAGKGLILAVKMLRGLQTGCQWGTDTCRAAAEGGQLVVLKWLRRPWGSQCLWDYGEA